MKAWLMNVFVLSAIMGRLIFSSLLGTLFVTLTLYLFTYRFTSLGTYSPWELVIWIDQQNEDTKGLIVSSALTVIGFLVAFQSASQSWKQELQANIRLQAANEIDSIYNQICLLISSLEIYSKMLTAALDKIDSGVSEQEIFQNLHFLLSQNDKFRGDRTQLTSLNINSYALNGRYSNVLFAINKGTELLGSINRAVESVTGAMWIILPEDDLLKYRDFVLRYKTKVDRIQVQTLIDRCETAHQFVSANSGLLKGKITEPIFELTSGTFINFFRHGTKLFRMTNRLAKGKHTEIVDLGGGSSS